MLLTIFHLTTRSPLTNGSFGSFVLPSSSGLRDNAL
jgi:hypothetical protein